MLLIHMLAFTFHKSLSKHAWVFGQISIFFFMLFVSENKNWVFRSLKIECYTFFQMVFWSQGAPLSTSSSFIPCMLFSCACHVKRSCSVYLLDSQGESKWAGKLFKVLYVKFFSTYTLFGPFALSLLKAPLLCLYSAYTVLYVRGRHGMGGGPEWLPQFSTLRGRDKVGLGCLCVRGCRHGEAEMCYAWDLLSKLIELIIWRCKHTHPV